MKGYDIAVVGAGIFGSWIAYVLQQAGCNVTLIDRYGAGNDRASSGGESRIIRMGYGADEIYSRWAADSLECWKTVFAETNEEMFYPTGVLSFAVKNNDQIVKTATTLKRIGIPFEDLSRAELDRRYPQFDFGSVEKAVLEPNGGAVSARRVVGLLIELCVRRGVQYKVDSVEMPFVPGKRVDHIVTGEGDRIVAHTFIFACGPWLAKVFPEVLGSRLFITRQEEFFFRAPGRDSRFVPPAFPVWIETGEFYGFPDLAGKGIKIASDAHGAQFDPDLSDRVATEEGLNAVRNFMARRLPSLEGAPLIHSRVCQFENTSNGDFLIDKYPGTDNVWIVGGGSGHGFKHGPSIGKYVADRVLKGGVGEERFHLLSKTTVKKRMVY